VSQAILNIGPNAEGQAPNTGVFQNRISPSGNAIWTLGKHTLSFGANYSFTQLNTIDKRTGTGTVATDDFSQMIQGLVTPGSSSTGFYVSSFLQGNASRYYRANQLGTFIQDKFQVTPRLSLTAGVRYDWDGGLTEKYGRIFNFDPSLYSYNVSSDVIENPGLIIAGNNANGTKGCQSTTLTGRQWGIAPRVGAAWQPAFLHDKVVIPHRCWHLLRSRRTLQLLLARLRHRHGHRRPIRRQPAAALRQRSSCPLGQRSISMRATSRPAAEHRRRKAISKIPTAPRCWLRPTTPKPRISATTSQRPIAGSIENFGQPISLGVYDRQQAALHHQLHLDIQWQPRNDLAIELGYVGNVGRHQVIPVPFNQPNIASPSSPNLAGGPISRTTPTATPLTRRNLPDGSPTRQTTKAATSISAFPTSATRRSPSATKPPASMPTTRSRPRRKAHEPRPSRSEPPTPTRTLSMNRAVWASSTTATTHSTCAAAMVQPTSTAPMSSTSTTSSSSPTSPTSNRSKASSSMDGLS
jgi:hypothetical protein